MRPLRRVTTLTRPCVSRSAWARSFSWKGQRSTVMIAAMRVARLGLGHADLRQLGIGIGDPRQRAVIDLGRQAEQRVADDDAGVIAGDMGELRPARDIADGIDAAVGGAQAPVDDERAALVRRDPGLVEVEPGEVGAPPGRDQQMRALDALLAGAVGDDGDDALAGALDAADIDARLRWRCRRR